MVFQQVAGQNREIERLYRLEFSDVGELTFRLTGSLIGAVLIWIYTGWLFVWAWIGIYLVLQFSFLFFLRTKIQGAHRLDVFAAHSIFIVVLISYLWMPIFMISSSDDALSASGFCILAGAIVFTVHRSEEYLKATLIQIGTLSLCLAVGVVIILARYDDPVAWAGLGFAVVALTFYLIHSAFIVRRHRLKADEIALRTTQAEKLQAIGQLAGGVAHDFNNMLTAVLGNLDLIEEIDDPNLRRELLKEARMAALRGAQVVRQLMTYARQTDGQPRQVSTNDLLGSVEALCKTLIPSSVTLKIYRSQENLYVRADEALLIAALLNLIKNGVDAVDASGVVSVSMTLRILPEPLPCLAGQMLAPGQYVAFHVGDTGHGIPRAHLHRVADPFFTTKVVGKGSGLGLSMVAGFAVKAGGGVEIRTSSIGTNVTILLPRVISVAHDAG